MITKQSTQITLDFHLFQPLFIGNQNRNITFIDLFAGIGGFHQALHNQGANCIFASELDNKCRETYQANFEHISPNLFAQNHFAGDITKINPSSIPNHDILCAGFPCQPFSISGKQKGFDDTRGTLFFNILEIIQTKKPKVVFLENVKHLVHHDNGNTLRVIIEQLEQLNYKTSWQVLNAKDFGLAQNRERIIIASQKFHFDFSKIKTKKIKLLKTFWIMMILSILTQVNTLYWINLYGKPKSQV